MGKSRIFIVGHSHIKALMRAEEANDGLSGGMHVDFLSLRDERFAKPGLPPHTPENVKLDPVLAEFSRLAQKSILIVFCLNGNEHNNAGMFESPTRTFDAARVRVKEDTAHNYNAWWQVLMPHCAVPGGLLLPPPPVESAEFIMGTEKVKRLARALTVRDAQQRLDLWRTQCDVIAELGRVYGLEVISLPKDVFSPSGFLAEDCRRDTSHGNEVYGARVLRSLEAYVSSPEFKERKPQRAVDNRKHPYRFLPSHCFWKQSVTMVASDAVDPVTEPPFKIGPLDKVATAGSCFAQHISKHLRAGGFRFLVTEAQGETAGDGASSFHDFSARYGNVYTARQLLQLFDRAFGYFRPLERAWKTTGGRFCDPFRPTIEPEAYLSPEAVIRGTQEHLAAVRKMFRQLDVFVFTLGLTECWVSRLDGAVYPMAPGVAGGEYESGKYEFVNHGVTEIVRDMQLFVQKLRAVNPTAKVILTVSPVPLAATYENRHVLVSTTYSKAVLRVAAEEVAVANQNVYYFPSFEIITGSHAGGNYFEEDRRGVTAMGVNHVMRIFMSRLTDDTRRARRGGDDEDLDRVIAAMGEVMCDEEMLAR